MSALSVSSPFPIFTDIDGQPLEDGYIWIGQANLDPQGNPINVYWDAALTLPAAQPVRTRGGYPVNSGTPARLYVNSDYSIRVMNKNGSVVYSAPVATERYSADLIGFTGFKGQSGTVEDLAGNDGADWIGFEADSGSAVPRSMQDKARDVVSAFDFLPAAQIAFIEAQNSASQDASVVTAALQAALDTGKVVFMPVGTYRTNAPLIISKSCRGLLGEIFGDGDGTRIDYHGTDAAIKLYDGTSGTRRVTQARVENIAIRVQNAGVNGIDFTDASYCTFRDLFIRLLNSNQAGIYGKGNGLGSSPYYNIFDGVKIFGNADNVTNPGQRGYYFQGELTGGFASNGPNANMISNGGQISGVSHGVHMESGTGNVFSNMIMESIAEYAYRIGNALSATPGRADQNSVVNHWMEGTSTCVFARFEGDAASNSLTNYSINSVSPIPFDNQSSSESNYCKPGGNFYVVSFYGQNIPASATTPLAPTNASYPAGGGVIPPFLGMVPYLMKVSVHNFASGGLGSGVVQAYRSGTPNPNLAFTVNNANRFGGTAIQSTPNTSLAYNTFDGTINSQIEVAVTTDGTWNQTTSDIEVQVIFFG
jgi:hypothetical protein